MKYFKNILIGILFIQLFSSLIFAYIGYFQYRTVLDMVIQKKEYNTNHLTKNIFKHVGIEYSDYGNKILSNPDIIEAFASNDRKRLLELTMPLYKKMRLQNPYLYIMHFHTVDTHSYLRVHKPKKFGDNLYNIRPIIVKTNELKQQQFGLETGKYGIYYRITFPVFKDGIHIGAFEFGIDIKYLISKLSMLNIHVPSLVVFNKAVDSIYQYSKTSDQYLTAFNEEYSLIKFKANKEEKLENLDLIDSRIIDTSSYFKKNNNKEYLVFRGLTLKDYENKPIGHFVFIDEMQEYMSTIEFLKWMSIGSIITLFIFTVILIYRLINNYTSELEKTVQDRTNELAETVDKLTKSQEQLIESEKMASLGSLVAGVAHEINTPIGVSLTGISHIDHEVKKLEKDYNGNNLSEEALVDYIAIMKELSYTIHGSLDNAAKLIKSFKHISVDQHSDELRFFNLKEYVDDILLSLRSQLKSKQVKVVNKIDSNIDIDSYPGMFSQILSNLILNSIKHGFVDNNENVIEISAQYDDVLVIDYKDNGKGVSEDIESKIFDPFFTTTRGQGGSGLGLNIVYNLITQKLGGNIKIIQAKTKGLHFQITLENSMKKGSEDG